MIGALPGGTRERRADGPEPRAVRERINEIVRERQVRDTTGHGPAMNTERLVSKGCTNAEKTLAANYAPGDVVAFRRPYKAAQR